MRLIDLIVFACSLSDPTACRDYHMLYQSAESLYSCTMRAETHLVQ